MTGVILDIDHFATHDGPGIRTCVFLKGCPMRCAWCHSPESQRFGSEVLFAPSRCIHCGLCAMVCPQGLHSFDGGEHRFILDDQRCTRCGACVEVCHAQAMFRCGREMTTEAVVREALEDRVFYAASGGGVTLSGGEVLAQPEFTREILAGLRAENIHTIVETTCVGDQAALLALVPLTSEFYVDYKLGDALLLRQYTGIALDAYLRHLETLRERTSNITLRIPLIPTITDTEENILQGYALAQRLDIRSVHLLPYNTMAGAKYVWCGRDYPLASLDSRGQTPEHLRALAPSGLHVSIQH